MATQPARVQVCGQTIRPSDDVCVGVAPIALDDQLAVRNRCRDGCGDGGHGEFDCGVGHQASHGWCGSKRTIRPLASLSTAPSAAVMVAVMKTFRPSISVIVPRASSGSLIGVILR